MFCFIFLGLYFLRQSQLCSSKACIISPLHSQKTMEPPIIGIYSPEKTMGIINNRFLLLLLLLFFFSFFLVVLTYLLANSDRNKPKRAKLVQTVTGWSLSCMKFTFSRDKFWLYPPLWNIFSLQNIWKGFLAHLHIVYIAI